jgi:hypothetical protein
LYHIPSSGIVCSPWTREPEDLGRVVGYACESPDDDLVTVQLSFPISVREENNIILTSTPSGSNVGLFWNSIAEESKLFADTTVNTWSRPKMYIADEPQYVKEYTCNFDFHGPRELSDPKVRGLSPDFGQEKPWTGTYQVGIGSTEIKYKPTNIRYERHANGQTSVTIDGIVEKFL